MSFLKITGIIILSSVIIFAGFYFIPWQKMDWGKVQVAQVKTITVTGQAQSQEKNQIANFNAGFYTTSDNKDQAVAEVNQKIGKLIDDLKNFGIKSEDIQTTNSNISQREEIYYDNGRQLTRPGVWSVSNSVSITLRDVEKASALTDLLAKSGANNVNGPYFSFDDAKTAENSLLEKAIDNARAKADVMAAKSNLKIKGVVSVVEGGESGSIVPLRMEGIGAGGGAPIEPGSSNIQKTVTVVYEVQ